VLLGPAQADLPTSMKHSPHATFSLPAPDPPPPLHAPVLPTAALLHQDRPPAALLEPTPEHRIPPSSPPHGHQPGPPIPLLASVPKSPLTNFILGATTTTPGRSTPPFHFPIAYCPTPSIGSPYFHRDGAGPSQPRPTSVRLTSRVPLSSLL
jgi:hypothetical protein